MSLLPAGLLRDWCCQSRLGHGSDARAAQESVLCGHRYLQSSFEPKKLGGAMVVAAVISGPCPRIFFFLASLLRCQDRGLGPWFISLAVMSWVLCGPFGISHYPQPKSPAVGYDARRPRSRRFWNALVSGERYSQPISRLFLVTPVEFCGAGRLLRCAEPKSFGTAKTSSSALDLLAP
jgi:hypothetical protein